MERHMIKKTRQAKGGYALRKHLKIDKQSCHLWAVQIVGNFNFCVYFLLYVSVVHNDCYVDKWSKYILFFICVIFVCS
jgi:hypothetical protein